MIKAILFDLDGTLLDRDTSIQNFIANQSLDTLLIQGYLLGIITNGLGVFQKRAIQGLGINRYFQTILISEVEGVRFPRRRNICACLI